MSTPQNRHELLELSLDGLSVGDAFGERFFGEPERVTRRIAARDLPPPPWHFTDDTVMAISIVEVLKSRGEIDADALAVAFARRYRMDPMRGYGGNARGILAEIAAGRYWERLSSRAFDGRGSKGNGGAMRAGPIGAFFHDDPARVVKEAKLSAAVTHYHPEGQAGAIAVALAASWACIRSAGSAEVSVFDYLLDNMSEGVVRDGVARAREIGLQEEPSVAGKTLGTGYEVLAEDTVPFCIWIVARHPDNYEEALWSTVSALGDRDTTCAIVGSIVAISAGENSIPSAWLIAREPLSVMQ